MAENNNEVREALEGFKGYYGDNIDDDMEVTKWFRVLTRVAQSLLDAEGEFPKKLEFGEKYNIESNCDYNYVGGFNSAISQCLPAHLSLMAKKDSEIEKLKSMLTH